MPKQAVFIMTDTQGANCVSGYGNPAVRTPSIDRLASEGVRFERAYTTCPLCTPARAALFTGLYSHSAGAWGNELALGAGVKTLGERLTDAGYHCGYTGKWHLAATDYFGDGNSPEGWDPKYWFDGRNHVESLPDELRSFSRRPHDPEEMADAGLTREMLYGHQVTERAIAFLREHAGEDFLLVVSYDEPHHPYLAPDGYIDEYREFVLEMGEGKTDDLEDKPLIQRLWAGSAGTRGQPWAPSGRNYRNPNYFACNTWIDSEIGRVCEAVDEHAPDSLLIYTSDHGEMMHSHRLTAKGPAMYREIVHVPLVVRWPGVVAPGTTDSRPFSHIDLFPTILDYFDVKRPPLLQGRSAVGRLSGSEEAEDGCAFIEFNRFNERSDGMGGFCPIRCIVTDRYKLALKLLYTDELYDLQEDPAELHNRIADPELAAVRDSLHGEIIEWMNRTRDPFRGPPWEVRHWHGRQPDRFVGGDRPKPSDGYRKPVLIYFTGRPEGAPEA